MCTRILKKLFSLLLDIWLKLQFSLKTLALNIWVYQPVHQPNEQVSMLLITGTYYTKYTAI